MADSYEHLKGHFDRIAAKNREDRSAVVEQRDELLAALKRLVEMYGPSTDYADAAAIAWADAEDVIAKTEKHLEASA